MTFDSLHHRVYIYVPVHLTEKILSAYTLNDFGITDINYNVIVESSENNTLISMCGM